MTIYGKWENDQITEETFHGASWRNVSFGRNATDAEYAAHGLYPITESVPEYNPDTHKLTGPTLSFDGTTITRAYTAVELTQEELTAKKKARVPAKVSMRKARLAMLQAGILDQVQTAIDAMEGTDGKVAQIEWEYADGLSRNHATVEALALALGLTEDQIDDLFIAAGEIPE